MMISTLLIQYSAKSGEPDISASRRALVQIAEMLAAPNGQVVGAVQREAAPFDITLAALRVDLKPSRPVILRVAPEDRAFVIEGGAEALDVLSDNVRDFAANGGEHEHLHVEYFPEHFCLDESSLPAVVNVAPDGC